MVDPAAPAGNRSVAIGDNFFNPVTVTVKTRQHSYMDKQREF